MTNAKSAIESTINALQGLIAEPTGESSCLGFEPPVPTDANTIKRARIAAETGLDINPTNVWGDLSNATDYALLVTAQRLLAAWCYRHCGMVDGVPTAPATLASQKVLAAWHAVDGAVIDYDLRRHDRAAE